MAFYIKTEKSEVCNSDKILPQVNDKVKFFFDVQQFCDVTLIAENDGTKVDAHKMILSAASDYFLAMFGGSLCEANAKEVNFKDVDGHSLKLVVNFIYSGSIELTSDTVENLIKAAHSFQINALEDLCCSFIAKQLEPTNCLGIALFAEQYNYKYLFDTAESFACKNFMELRKYEEFFRLNADQLEKFLSNDDLSVTSEEEVFFSIMSWIDHDRINRDQFIDKLLNYVRFPFLSPKFIATTVELACKPNKCQHLLYDALKWHHVPELRLSLFSEEQMRERNYGRAIIAIGGWRQDILTIGFLQPSSNEWIYKELPGLRRKRTDFGYTTMNGHLIIVGGWLGPDDTNYVDSLDLKTLKWKEMTSLKYHRCDCIATVVKNTLYVVSGNINSTRSIEKLDPVTGVWRDVRDIPIVGSSLRAVPIIDSLCASVYESGTQQTIFNIYDPAIDSWTLNWLKIKGEVIGMGTVRDSSTDYFIVMTRTSVTKYNLTQNTKTCDSINAISLEFNKCMIHNNRVIVYGNKNLKEYFPFKNEWKALPYLKNHDSIIVGLN